MKLTVEQALLKGESHQKKGELDQARALYNTVIEAFPNNKRAKLALASLDQLKKSVVTTVPNPSKEQIDGLIALYSAGRAQNVIVEGTLLVDDFPSSFILWNILGAAHKAVGQLENAATAFSKAGGLNPSYPDAHNNLGVVLKDQGKLDDAIAAYKRALALKPDYAEAYNNMGVTLQKQGKLDGAIAAYERALALKSDYASAYNNMGNALKDKGKLDDAIAAYERALAFKPNYAKVHKNMGNALKDQGKLNDAIAAYERALGLKPDCAEVYNNMGNAFKDQRKLDDAIAAYERALALKPDYAAAEAQMLHQQRHMCDFNISSILPDASARLGITTEAIPPFAALPWLDNPEHQLQRSIKWANQQYRRPPSILQALPSTRPMRLKLGYFSADFHDHATLYLMAGLLREHDKQKFEIFAYSYGRSKSGQWRKQAEQTVDNFFDVTDMSDDEIYELARSHSLDVAVDLKGYTTCSRSRLFQYRLAPIQVNYLGYPGSMGADFIDYIVADPTVIPDEQRKFYSEKVIFLPHSYQPNDNLREIRTTSTSRTDFGLPENAFVFCCFNNSYKITPNEFDVWMRLLTKVEGSVLWLLKSNKWAEQNLRKEATERGVDPDRLVFAQQIPHAEHLARHKHADLFLDTFNVNAHTTASDALWGALPVVTKQGKQFAARVAASLLNAVGLSELIAYSEDEYEELILELALQPQKLREIRDKLNRNRLTEPLFDTVRYARNFEQGLQKAYDLYFSGNLFEDIRVDDHEL